MEFMLCILVGKGQGRSFKLEPDKGYTIGRHSENDIKIDGEHVSRSHIKIQVKQNRYFITDLGSKNGTFVGGNDLITGIETEIGEGVPIVIGMTILGLGAMCQSCLKPFLSSAGFFSEVNEYGDFKKPYRILTMKKNLEFIYDMNSFLMEAKDTKEIYKKLLNGIFNLFKRIDRCVIIIIDEQSGKIKNIMYRSRKPVEDPTKIYNKELLEKSIIMNKPVMVKDSSKSEYEDNKVTKSLQIMKIRSAMCVPIASCYSIRGVIYVDSLERSNGFRTSDAALLKDISGRTAIAIDNISIQMNCSLEDYNDLLEYLNNYNDKY